MYLAIDPGIFTGWAILDSVRKLVECGADAPPELKYAGVLIERPTVYPFSKADPANIITLAIGAGRYEERFLKLGARFVKWVEPRTWKGQVEKTVHHPRIYGALPEPERVVVAKCGMPLSKKQREDMMDAVGLAAYGRTHHIFA